MSEIVFGLPLAAIHPAFSSWALILAALLLIIRNDVIYAIVRRHMLEVAALAAQLSAAILLAGSLMPIWWHQWMYANWAGPPVWLSDALHATGSGVSSSIRGDMTIALLGTLITLVLFGNLFAMLRSDISKARVRGWR